MKTQTTFQNASLVSVVNGSIVVKDSTGREHTFTNASIVSVNDGTIIVEIEWEPKKGELVKALGGGIDCYIIFNTLQEYCLQTFGSKELSGSYYKLAHDSWAYNIDVEFHPVTPEEQKEFDDFCKSQGKIWNKETLQWEKYRWQPKDGDGYYYIDLEFVDCVGRHSYRNDSLDQHNYEHYNCFKTENQAKEAAEKVKELLKSL